MPDDRPRKRRPNRHHEESGPRAPWRSHAPELPLGMGPTSRPRSKRSSVVSPRDDSSLTDPVSFLLQDDPDPELRALVVKSLVEYNSTQVMPELHQPAGSFAQRSGETIGGAVGYVLQAARGPVPSRKGRNRPGTRPELSAYIAGGPTCNLVRSLPRNQRRLGLQYRESKRGVSLPRNILGGQRRFAIQFRFTGFANIE